MLVFKQFLVSSFLVNKGIGVIAVNKIADLDFLEFYRLVGQKVKSFWEVFLVVETCAARPEE